MPRSAPWCAATSLALPLLLAAAACSPWLGLLPEALDDDDGSGNAVVYAPRRFSGPGMVRIASGALNDCVIASGGEARCRGDNSFGTLGSGDARASAGSFVAVAGTGTYDAIAPGAAFPATCGIMGDSVAVCWGLSQFGSLGTGEATDSVHHSPTAVAGSHKFGAIASGGSSTCALTGAGAAYCWGQGVLGELGSGGDTTQQIPGLVTGGHAFTAVRMSGYHTCAITTSSAAYCWGFGDQGQLGIGAVAAQCGGSPCSRSPALVSGGHIWTALTTGQGHTCGIIAGGSAYCWGRGLVVGQLGVGKDTSTTTPMLVAGGHAWVAISAGREHTCGVTVDGFALCWGANDQGQLGTGSATPTHSNTPVVVAGSHFFVEISAASDHTCGLTGIGEVYCWGFVPP